MTISVGNLIVAGGATVDTSEVLSALNKQGLKVWVGTKTQRDALPENVKNDDKITFLTYDSEEDIYLIVDTIISYSKTWSSVKISTELAKKINSSDVYTKTEVMSLINSKVASALKYRGAVATVAALPSTGQENGDSYYVQADGYMYAWSSDYSDWQALGSATDMTNYYTKTEVDALLADMAVKFQYDVMPTADSTTVGKIIQYTGADTNDYKNGYWYKGVDNGDSTYDWAVESYNKSAVDDLISSNVLDNNYYGGFMASDVVWYKTGDLFNYPSAGGFWSSTFLLSDRNGAWTGILKVADNGAGTVSATITSLGGNPTGGEEFYYNNVSRCLYFCGTWDRLTITQLTGAKVALSLTSTTQEEAKQNTRIVPTTLATTDDIFHVGDRRDIIGWADLTSDVNIDGSSNYANNVGRIDGRNAMILVSNPTPSYQWPVTNSGNRNIFLDFGSYVQFFVDTVNNSLYVRSRDSVDMGNWGEIVTQNELKHTFALTRVDEHTCTFDLSSLPYAENGLCVINLMGNWNLEGSAACSIGYFEGAWRISSVTTLVDAGNVGTITASISGSTLTVSNTGVNYAGRLNVRVGQLF